MYKFLFSRFYMCYLTVSWCWRQYVYLIKLLFYFVIQRHYYWGQHVPFFLPLSHGFPMTFALSNDFLLAATYVFKVSVIQRFTIPATSFVSFTICVIQRLCTGGNMCIHVFFYCYPPVYYTGYIYLLSSDCVLAATCVSIFIVTVIQRFSILATIIRYPTTLYWRQYMCPFL